MTVDMEQFHSVFFEESLEGLDNMEQSLLAIDLEQDTDPELINTIFRAAHSIKGGSGTFGFNEVSEFTHVLETLLDEVRDGKRSLTQESVELLLQSCDCLRQMIIALQARQTPETEVSNQLVAKFNQLLADQPSPVQNDASNECESVVPIESQPDNKTWNIEFVPQPEILLSGNEPLRLFRELSKLGELKVSACAAGMPPFLELAADECHLSWMLTLADCRANKEDIVEIFEWVIDDCVLNISPADTQTSSEGQGSPAANVQEVPGSVEQKPESKPPGTEPVSKMSNKPADAPAATTPASSSIRVGIDKVDNLINLVGELVITQSMLSELGNNFEMAKLEKLSHGLEQLLQNTKELQESVMRIRMLPISFAFNRFPRMIRDLSLKIGKKVELVIHGENTELDKTVMEQISDPLVHLVRNAIDHGIETAEERAAKGKPEQGTIKLDAYHQGGNIVIEVADDGKGLNPNAIKTKAIEKGLIAADTPLADSEIYDLIFQPGFSTAQQVSDISGRGVGMDVVKRNIKALGGRIHIESQVDVGTTIKVHLPLTLAILDGQLVRVGQEVYIVPLLAIVESLQVKPELVNSVAGDLELYRLREDNVPIIRLYQELAVEADNTNIANALLVVVEGDGQKVGLMVDELMAQQQVVIKSLEQNYRRVEGISGATILGDGSVSMILDIPGLINHATTRSRVSNTDKAA